MKGFVRRLRFHSDHRWAPAHMSEYLDAETTAAGRRRMERHVAECRECRHLLAGLRAVLSALHDLGAPSETYDAAALVAAVRARIDAPR